VIAASPSPRNWEPPPPSPRSLLPRTSWGRPDPHASPRVRSRAPDRRQGVAPTPARSPALPAHIQPRATLWTAASPARASRAPPGPLPGAPPGARLTHRVPCSAPAAGEPLASSASKQGSPTGPGRPARHFPSLNLIFLSWRWCQEESVSARCLAWLWSLGLGESHWVGVRGGGVFP
jgi:hypothetical protein